MFIPRHITVFDVFDHFTLYKTVMCGLYELFITIHLYRLI